MLGAPWYRGPEITRGLLGSQGPSAAGNPGVKLALRPEQDWYRATAIFKVFQTTVQSRL